MVEGPSPGVLAEKMSVWEGVQLHRLVPLGQNRPHGILGELPPEHECPRAEKAVKEQFQD